MLSGLRKIKNIYNGLSRNIILIFHHSIAFADVVDIVEEQKCTVFFSERHKSKFWLVRCSEQILVKQAVNNFRGNKLVAIAEIDSVIQFSARPQGPKKDDKKEGEGLAPPFPNDLWHLIYPKVAPDKSAEYAWHYSRGATDSGRPIRVAVIDFGFQGSAAWVEAVNTQLSGRYSRNGYFESIGINELKLKNGILSRLKTWFNYRHHSPYHGTLCATMACGRAFKSLPYDSGAAPEAELVLLALPDAPTILTSVFIDALMRAAGLHATNSDAVDVISCSLGPSYENGQARLTPAIIAILQQVSQESKKGIGIPIFWATGHYSSDLARDELVNHPDVIAVGPSGMLEKAHAPRGGNLELIAPGIGVNIFHPRNQDFDRGGGGSSFSAPLVAGVTALLLGANPSLTAKEIRYILRKSCDKVHHSEADYDCHGHSITFGFGRINAYKAMQYAIDSQKLSQLMADPPLLPSER